jgi:hypothetical protein
MSRSALIRDRLFECIHNGELENDDLVRIIEHLSAILSLKTLTAYAESEHISYNAAKKRKKHTTTIGGELFVVDND